MSWEDCGFRPAPVEPEACPRGACSDCDGLHHFYVATEDDCDDFVFVCRHCDVTASAVDDDDVDEEEA